MTEFIYFDQDTPPSIPSNVAVCPICGNSLVIDDIDEWETDDGRVTSAGFHINCETEPEIGSDDWRLWHIWHWSTPYIDWLPVNYVVYQWFDARFRLRLTREVRP